MMPLRATKRRREYVGAFVHETVGAGVSLLLPAKADDASAASTNPAQNLIRNDKNGFLCSYYERDSDRID